jgi:8-amino-7-oxononanoate synthase
VFSRDGDFCPLMNIMDLCKHHKAHLIIDEAHSTGVVGEKGEGLAQHLHLHKDIFARVHTFGKACGCHGAIVLGSQNLRDFLINFARSLIYSTALPPHAIASIGWSYSQFPMMVNERKKLESLINYFQSATISFPRPVSNTPIQIVIVEGNQEVKRLANRLQENNLDIRPILYPTVPKGKERLRIVLHSFNSMDEVGLLIKLLSYIQ